jgi:signal recognition particle receptor subunit beta
MVTINYAFREISCKIVYYGPGLSGKTTNLQYVHDRVPSKSRGDLISLATETDRTLYFDFLPIHVGDIAGFATKFQLYTVPGQVFYNATRKLVLRGVDGIVFVADSQAAKMDENIESLSNMYENLRENGIDVNDIPIVIQYNKRDLPDIATVEELEKTLNPEGRAWIEASAVNGTGVFDTLKRITKLVLEQTKKRTAVTTETDAPAPGQAEPVTADVPAATPSGPDLSSSGKVHTAESELVRHTASPDATAVAEPKPAAAEPAPPQAAPAEEPKPAPPADSTVSPAPPPVKTPAGVHAPQRSLRIRRKQRSFLSRLFGWLFGR